MGWVKKEGTKGGCSNSAFIGDFLMCNFQKGQKGDLGGGLGLLSDLNLNSQWWLLLAPKEIYT